PTKEGRYGVPGRTRLPPPSRAASPRRRCKTTGRALRCAGAPEGSHEPRVVPFHLQAKRRQSGFDSDCFNVTTNAVARFGASDDRAAWRFDIDRAQADTKRAAPAHLDAAQERVDGFGMKGRERIRRIGIEAEHRAPFPRPGGSRGMRLIGTERARHDTAVAQSVKDRLAAMELDSANDVSVVADDDVRTGIDRRVRYGPLVRCQTRARVHDSFVQGYDDEIGTLPRRLDIRGHVTERRRIRPLEGGGRGDGSLTGGPYIYICAAGAVLASPGGFRTDAVVAQ